MIAKNNEWQGKPDQWGSKEANLSGTALGLWSIILWEIETRSYYNSPK
jgi:hypothetical protein